MRSLLFACCLCSAIVPLGLSTVFGQSCDSECEASIPGGSVTRCEAKLVKEDGWSRQAAVNACTVLLHRCSSLCEAPQEAALDESTTPILQFTGPEAPADIDIRWIQETLNSIGYPAGPADGQLGEQTKKAIEEFERSHGFVVTGEPSVNLQRHIAHSAAPLD